MRWIRLGLAAAVLMGMLAACGSGSGSHGGANQAGAFNPPGSARSNGRVDEGTRKLHAIAKRFAKPIHLRAQTYSFLPCYALLSRQPAQQGACNLGVVTDRRGRPIAEGQGAFADAYCSEADTTCRTMKLSPKDIAAAYHLPGDDQAGATQTIVILIPYHQPSARSDLQAFNAKWGLPQLPPCSDTVTTTCLAVVNQNGQASPQPPVASDPTTKIGAAAEAATDLETAHQVCHKCKLVLMELNAFNIADVAVAIPNAVKLGATQISSSLTWGETADLVQSYASVWNQPGVAITSATADWGWAPDTPTFPADLPTVIGVGADILFLDATNPNAVKFQREYLWTEGTELKDGGSSSACSKLVEAPSWQAAQPQWGNVKCGTKRSIVDISAVGWAVWAHGPDPVNGTEGDWLAEGTSVSAPMAAGWLALVMGHYQAAHNGQKLTGNIQQYLYQHPDWFYDVYGGGRGGCDSTGHCSVCPGVICYAVAGYDGGTGLGSIAKGLPAQP